MANEPPEYESDLDPDCKHLLIDFPWYQLCLYCYGVTLPPNYTSHGVTTREGFDAQVEANEGRVWHHITVNDEIYMDIMRELICPRCSGIIAEENLRRRDGSICTGFSCTRCDQRWWVEES